MNYEIAKLKAQEFANEKCNPVYIAKAEHKFDFCVIFDMLELTKQYSVVETVNPTTTEYLQKIINRETEEVIELVKSLPRYEINGQKNYVNASDVMDIVIFRLRRLQS